MLYLLLFAMLTLAAFDPFLLGAADTVVDLLQFKLNESS
jgi:hypothetical protein